MKLKIFDNHITIAIYVCSGYMNIKKLFYLVKLGGQQKSNIDLQKYRLILISISRDFEPYYSMLELI